MNEIFTQKNEIFSCYVMATKDLKSEMIVSTPDSMFQLDFPHYFNPIFFFIYWPKIL